MNTTAPSNSTLFHSIRETCTQFISLSKEKFAESLNETPLEGVAFLIASAVVRIFSHPLVAPLVGIGLSIITTKLVLKSISTYDHSLTVNLTKETCKLRKKYPKLQLIGFIFACAISFASKTLGFASGFLVGTFGSIVFDVERYKLMQSADRTALHQKV
ncbi:MAG: hypothetical protein WCG42_05370 [Parachlamydiaceae bacterium]